MSFKTKYNELKKIKNFLIILLNLVFSDKINNEYWMKFMAINAVTYVKDYLFCFKNRMKRLYFKKSLTSLGSAIPGKNYPSRLIALIYFRMQHWSYKFCTLWINIIFCVSFYQIWCLTAFVKVAYALFICQDII